MLASLDMAQLIALAGALGWASGIRLYMVVLLTGLAGWMGWIVLPQGLQLLAHPVVLGTSGFMVLLNFLPTRFLGWIRSGMRYTASFAYLRVPHWQLVFLALALTAA